MERLKILKKTILVAISCLFAFMCVFAPLTVLADTMVETGYYDVPISNEALYSVNASTGSTTIVRTQSYGSTTSPKFAPTDVYSFSAGVNYVYLFKFDFNEYTVNQPAIIEVVFTYSGTLNIVPYDDENINTTGIYDIGTAIQIHDNSLGDTYLTKPYYYENRKSTDSSGNNHGQLILRFAVDNFSTLYGVDGFNYALTIALASATTGTVDYFLQSFQAVPTTQLIVDSINGVNNSIDSATQQIVNALNNSSSTGLLDKIVNPNASDEEWVNDFENKKNEQTEELDGLVSDMDSMNKPSSGDIISDTNEYISSDSVAEYSNLLSTVTNNSIVTTMLLSALSIALVGYVLFGKR